MAINRRDIIQMLRDENELLKMRNKQVGNRLARLQQAFRVLNTIDEKTQNLTVTPDLEELFHQLLELVLHTCNCENGSVIMLDDNTQELEFVEVIGGSRDALMTHRISLNTGIVGETINTGKAKLVENVHASNKWSSSIDEYLSFHTESLMCSPLKMGNRVIGAIELVSHSGDRVFDENDLNVLLVASGYVGRALEQAEKLMISTEVGK
ncbi:MAG: GAF domain-containing protein [Gammaproteobacteria bacterium]|jgi:GAF domain-containing protein|nr:GAF domain-containing protein [Gammaproteobacteria bacterium]MBT3724985.1 GAF domain-containing protein [Gammaproteobacteria bacterium]MBT4075388.1 GAF domain-containing protein [Gammaproteobacteria bacterium]MBT4194713.1 GAF domain-containing protein [Gammaproteobacteria bacterium]MBT4449697.1 GAF domain-containing protein [Gammaproteobacteria bacterium]